MFVPGHYSLRLPSKAPSFLVVRGTVGEPFMIPRNVRPFFWDVNLDTFDPTSYPGYTIARILEYGDDAAVQWLCEAFTKPEIEEVIRTERRLSRRSAAFWALVYRIPYEEVAALKRDP
jgi:hypothetical protein